MLSYFTRNSSSPSGQPTSPATTAMVTTHPISDDGSGLPPPLPPPLPASHIIHSPLPSRPSPTQPAHVLDALLRGAHAASSPSPAPTAESSTTSFSAHHAPASHPDRATPQSFNHGQQPAQTQPDRGIDLLAMLTNAANASQTHLQQPQQPPPQQALLPQSQPPQPARLPVDDPKTAGRMILDSLLKYVPFALSDLLHASTDAEHAVVQLSAAGLALYCTCSTIL